MHVMAVVGNSSELNYLRNIIYKFIIFLFKNKRDTNNGRVKWDHIKTIQKMSEQHTGKQEVEELRLQSH